jgi:hypothetical protein
MVSIGRKDFMVVARTARRKDKQKFKSLREE